MRSRWFIVPAIGLGLLLAGCSTSASSGPTSAGAGVGGSAAAGTAAGGLAPGAVPSAPENGLSKSAGNPGVVVHMSPASIIYTADLSVRAADVSAASDKAAQIAEAAGGYVSDESSSSGTGAAATVTLKIPVVAYPQTLNQLATQLGRRLSLKEQAQDVTQQVTDVNSQVASYEAAIAQLRGLLTHAGSVGDLLTVQNQINGEEANLEQVQAEQRQLAHQTSYATVTVSIVPTPVAAAPHHAKAAPPPGLTRGLRGGWHALRVSFSWTLAVLGALAPFIAIAAVAAFAVYRGRRWRLRRKAA